MIDNEASLLTVEPIISYPRKARSGNSYLLSIDLRPSITSEDDWPFEGEEYVVYCLPSTAPLFTNQALGEPAVVVHRYGGSYGPATFLLKAAEEEMVGTILITFVNSWGVPIIDLPLRDIQITGREVPETPDFVLPAQRATEASVSVPPLQEPLESSLLNGIVQIVVNANNPGTNTAGESPRYLQLEREFEHEDAGYQAEKSSSPAVSGTGFIVSADGLIVTCAHVLGIPMPEKVNVVFQTTGEMREATTIAEWWRNTDAEDVAFLRIDGSLPERAYPLLLGSSQGTKGHSIRTFGYPAARMEEGLWAMGEVVGTVGIMNKEGQPLLQLRSNEITAGFSGAPAWDELRRRVIGMIGIVSHSDSFGRLNEVVFAIPAETLREICPVLQISDTCPYRGLEMFTEADAPFFFGRERTITRLVESLRREPRFLAVFGPSGSGKSSILHAGLIPRLRHGGIPGSESWRIITTRPGDSTFRVQLASLNQVSTHTAIIIDQLEELFLIYSELERKEVMTRLTEILEAASSVTVILSMRDDFYSLFVQQEQMAQWLQYGLVNVPQAISSTELVSIIQRPAQAVGLRFEEGLIERIVGDTLGDNREGGNIVTLPLLEFLLTQLWEKRQNGELTHEAYLRIGGTTGALAHWADSAFYNIEQRLRPIARDIFTSLIYLGNEAQGISDTRRRLPFSSLIKNEAERRDVYQVVQRLASARLLVVSRDAQGDEIVEIIHEALLWEWGLLKQWVEEDRNFLLWHQKLAERAQEWMAAQRDVDMLLRGRTLTEAEEWLKARPSDLTSMEQAFIQASQKKAQPWWRNLLG